jgi:cytochrome P450
MPAFHREQIDAAVDVMVEETERALASWQPGDVVDVYEWARELAMRVAMRALLGLDPDDRDKGAAAAYHFERALSFYGIDFHLRLLRGPGTPWRRLKASREVLDEIVYGEIAHRRAEPDPERRDVLSLLLEARDEDGSGFSDQEVRDQLMTLLFAGHDTSTSTISFLLYELARHPHALARIYDEQERVLGSEPPTAEHLNGGLRELEMALDETLRLYPPAWIGSRRAVESFEFGGHQVPAGARVYYCSWASHRLPHVFPDPEAFIPERFERERKARLPKGAYVPFGGGSRICIGKRFGQTEIKTVATMLLQRFRLELPPGRTMTVRQMPTLSPRGGLRMVVRERGVPASLATVA